MKRSFSVPALSVPALAAFLGAAMTASVTSAEPLQSGVLDCNVAPGPGFLIGSSKDVSCVFHPAHGRPEYYAGRISRFGVDVGLTGATQFSWGVFTEGAIIGRYALAGYYAGAGFSFAVGAGPSADALVGGEGNAINLIPLSSISTGLNLSAGVGSLMLQPSPIPPRPIQNPG
jgi:Protein of unknown function (DUF992)